MIIKFDDYCGENTIVNIPDGVPWMLCYKPYDTDFFEEGCNLYLIVEDRTILIRDEEYHPDLTSAEIEVIYKAIVDEIFARLEQQPTLKTLNINSLEKELVATKV